MTPEGVKCLSVCQLINEKEEEEEIETGSLFISKLIRSRNGSDEREDKILDFRSE